MTKKQTKPFKPDTRLIALLVIAVILFLVVILV